MSHITPSIGSKPVWIEFLSPDITRHHLRSQNKYHIIFFKTPQQIAETWWHRMISARKEDRGKPSMRPNKVRQELPLEMKEQITGIFRRMREETEGNQWDVDYWRNETLALAQAWWDKFTDRIMDSE